MADQLCRPFGATARHVPTPTVERVSLPGHRCLIWLGPGHGRTSGLCRQSVILTGRSAGRLQSVAQHLIEKGADPVRLVTIPADLTVEDNCQRLFDEVAGLFDALDLVVNLPGSERTASSRHTIRR